ncbi:hypothetical protein [Winslowiella iniecta]|uniref:hypothetical protein n=1 Tax=Winslowiella iniecta TaxID=1560201 RepID=UPI000AC7A93D|nr:hypothetical protein [Winslowiella iniecta]
MKIKMMLIGWLAFIGCDFLLAMMSLQVRDVWSLSALVWFPAGLLLGVLCTLPLRFWPIWLLSSALLHLVASQLYGRPVNVSLIFSFFDTLLITVTALIWQFFYGVMARPVRRRDIIALALLCAASGIIERFVTIWALLLLDYPIDPSISVLHIAGYAISSLPVTFFVFYLVTRVNRTKWDISGYLMVLAMSLMMLALFFLPLSALTDALRWQDLALMFSLTLPVLLALRGDLLLLSGFLSLCSTVAVGATLFGHGPFHHILPSQQEDVLIAAWYSAALSLPALLCASLVNQKSALLARHRWREQLMDTVLQHGLYHRFELESNDGLRWLYQSRWQGVSHAPVYWQQFIGWIHPDDRLAVEQLKNSASATPQVLPIRLADRHGEFHQSSMALVACQEGQVCWFEGVIFPQQTLLRSEGGE